MLKSSHYCAKISSQCAQEVKSLCSRLEVSELEGSGRYVQEVTSLYAED